MTQQWSRRLYSQARVICVGGVLIGMLGFGAGQVRSDDWLGGTSEPASVSRAKAAHDTAVKRAEEVWLNAQKTAKQNYLRAVESSYQNAVSLKKSDEIASLKKIKDQLTQELVEIEVKLKGPSAIKTVTVDALIDGNSELWVTPTGMYWKSLGGAAKPGLHEGANAQTYINSAAWTPVWKIPENQNAADVSEPYALALGAPLNFAVQIVAIGGNPGVKDFASVTGVEQRDPVTIRSEGMNQVVSIPDTQNGSKWYRLKLTRVEQK